MPYDIEFYKDGFAGFSFAKLVIGGEQVECVAEEYETGRVWVRTGYHPAPQWAQGYNGGPYGSAWDDMGYGSKLEQLVDELLESLEDMIKARSKPFYDIAGHHPIDGHPLNASGVATVKAKATIAKAKGEA